MIRLVRGLGRGGGSRAWMVRMKVMVLGMLWRLLGRYGGFIGLTGSLTFVVHRGPRAKCRWWWG